MRSGRVWCKQCDKSYDPEDAHIGKNGKRLCPCCHTPLRASSRNTKSKRDAREYLEEKQIKLANQ